MTITKHNYIQDFLFKIWHDERGSVGEETEADLSTDEEILSNIGEGDESTTSESTSTENTGTTENVEGQTSTAGDQQGTDKGGTTQQTQQTSGPQDLKDRAGNVIASGGRERRFYETAQREKQRADGLTREIETLNTQIAAINEAGTLGTQYDLTPEELTTGAQLIANYKKDPIGTLKFMLTQAQSAGHNIEELGVGNGLDANTLKQLIDNAVQPLVLEHTQRTEKDEVAARAQEIYNNFVSVYPDATIHENSLARLLEKEPSLTPEAAYFKLKSYYLERKLDFTKSLETLQQEQANTTETSGNTQQSLPRDGINTGNVTDTAEVADVNKSFDDIIRESMKDAGMV